MMAEQCRRLLDGLPDEQLRALALAKLEGHTNEEIARQLSVSLRTVERRLRLIRDEWKQELR
jgi:DNA-directed RNA polymerase specialized sigma24 family protein